jgi:hypothetical protein
VMRDCCRQRVSRQSELETQYRFRAESALMRSSHW